MSEVSRIIGICESTVRDSLIRSGISPKLFVQGIKHSKRRGSGQVGGNSPYGFKYERGNLVPHPQEFETLILILKWSDSLLSLVQIAARLNAEKLRPRRSLAWSRFTVRDIVKWHLARPDVIPNREGTCGSSLISEASGGPE
jgi:hypothetical protein